MLKLTKIDKNGVWFEAFAGDKNRGATHKLTLKLNDHTKLGYEILLPDSEDNEGRLNVLIKEEVLDIVKIEKIF